MTHYKRLFCHARQTIKMPDSWVFFLYLTSSLLGLALVGDRLNCLLHCLLISKELHWDDGLERKRKIEKRSEWNGIDNVPYSVVIAWWCIVSNLLERFVQQLDFRIWKNKDCHFKLVNQGNCDWQTLPPGAVQCSFCPYWIRVLTPSTQPWTNGRWYAVG